MTKRRKITVGGLAILILAAAIVGRIVISQLNQPVSGVITTGPSPVKTGYSIDLTPKKQTGKYVTFDYPSGLTPHKPGPVTAPDLETFTYSARDTTSWLLAVDVSMPRGGLLSEDSGYALRKNNPATYQASSITINKQPVIIMSDKTLSFSKVAYVMHGPLLATVALKGDDASGTQPLSTSLTMVLSSLKWL